MAHPFSVQDKFTRKTQDLNPECKEGSFPIMLMGVLLGFDEKNFLPNLFPLIVEWLHGWI